MTENRVDEIIMQLQTETDQGKCDRLWEDLYQICKSIVGKISHSKNYCFEAAWSEEDYMQEVMLLLFRNYRNYDQNLAGFATWFSTISMNRYNRHWKALYTERKKEAGEKEKKRKLDTTSLYIEGEDREVNLMDLLYSVPSAEDDYISNDSFARLCREIQRLPKNYRDAVRLCDLDGHKPSQAATIMDCKSADVSRWLNRAHVKLRRCLEEERMEDEPDLDPAA